MNYYYEIEEVESPTDPRYVSNYSLPVVFLITNEKYRGWGDFYLPASDVESYKAKQDGEYKVFPLWFSELLDLLHTSTENPDPWDYEQIGFTLVRQHEWQSEMETLSLANSTTIEYTHFKQGEVYNVILKDGEGNIEVEEFEIYGYANAISKGEELLEIWSEDGN